MTKVKAILLGIPQRRFEPQKYFHTSVKKPKIEYRELFSFEFECEETFKEIKVGAKYKYLPHPVLERKKIVERFGLKIPIFIRKLVWKLEEVVS